MFTADVFFYLFVSFWHFAGLYLRVASADRRETFKYNWMCVNLDNVSTKIGGVLPPPKKKWGPTVFPI